MDNIQLVLAKLLDKDDSGEVTPNEIADFFIDIWDNKDSRKRINEISKDVIKDDTDVRSYKLIEQICKELGLDYYFEIIKNKGVTTKMFLNSSFEALKLAFKEIDSEHVSLLFLKAQAHNDRKKFFLDIKARAIIVEHDARDAAHDVEKALQEGKLTETTHEGHTFLIEDPENGNGLCVFKNKNNEQMLCRRRAWKAHGFPGRYTNN